jgi:hypothetical protein
MSKYTICISVYTMECLTKYAFIECTIKESLSFCWIDYQAQGIGNSLCAYIHVIFGSVLLIIRLIFVR